MEEDGESAFPPPGMVDTVEDVEVPFLSLLLLPPLGMTRRLLLSLGFHGVNKFIKQYGANSLSKLSKVFSK